MLIPSHLSQQEADVFGQVMDALRHANIAPQHNDDLLIEELSSQILMIRHAYIEARSQGGAGMFAEGTASNARAGAIVIAKALRLPREALSRLLWVQ